MKELQHEIIYKVIAGQDVFAVLPTNYGKSLLQVPPVLFDKFASLMNQP